MRWIVVKRLVNTAISTFLLLTAGEISMRIETISSHLRVIRRVNKMKAFTAKHTKLALATLAFTASVGAQAATTPFTFDSLVGFATTYTETSPGLLTGTLGNAPVAEVLTALNGAGNVELNKFASNGVPGGAPVEVTQLNGNFAGVPVTLSSLVLSDWTNNGNALAEAYISGAAGSVGVALTPGDLSTLVTNFLTGSVGGIEPWRYVSDPNVSSVSLVDGVVQVALDGFYNATPILNALFPGVANLPAFSQVSEVAKISYGGSDSYFYSFHAKQTGYQTRDGSYSGSYVVPTPDTLWLMGIGLAALAAGRRGAKASRSMS
jgi:hypothetical protein